MIHDRDDFSEVGPRLPIPDVRVRALWLRRLGCRLLDHRTYSVNGLAIEDGSDTLCWRCEDWVPIPTVDGAAIPDARRIFPGGLDSEPRHERQLPGETAEEFHARAHEDTDQRFGDCSGWPCRAYRFAEITLIGEAAPEILTAMAAIGGERASDLGADPRLRTGISPVELPCENCGRKIEAHGPYWRWGDSTDVLCSGACANAFRPLETR